MKNQYFGDINDYRKYGLLRAIIAATDLRPLVAWMLTPDDGGRDGNLTAYLEAPNRWESHDQTLFRELKRLISSDQERNVALLEATRLLERSAYFSAVVPDDKDGRKGWFSRLQQCAESHDFVFLDPDNGLEVKSRPRRRRNSSKYLHWEEVDALWSSGKSLLIYQHFIREKRQAFIQRLLARLQENVPKGLVEAFSTPRVVFLMALQPRHRPFYEAIIKEVQDRWGKQIRHWELTQPQSYPECSKPMTGALAHLKVLDLSRVLAGPWASQLLADLGAEVIKVEKPGSGDDTRHWGPPWLAGGDGQPTGEAAYFLCTNRNKRSLTVDIAQPAGQAIVRKLAADADVVIENFKVGGLAPYGLDYASLRALNPALVYCSITGFGQDGPYAARAGYDFLIQGMGGLMSLTGVADGEPGAGPQKVGVALTDILTGLYAGNAILAALAHRDRAGFRHGEGQHIDLALLDVQVACLANQALNHLVSGAPPRRMGNAHPNIVPYQDFPTADGDMILAIGNDGQFARFCVIAAHAEWATDERFATNAARVAHRRQLIALLRQATVMRTTADWIAALEAEAVPCGPINALAAVFADPQVKARGLALDLQHRLGGVAPQVANPIRLSATPVAYRRAPPTLGQDTGAVLRELGYGENDIADLRRKGIV